MNTSQTHDPMRVSRVEPTRRNETTSKPTGAVGEQAPTPGDWRERTHQELRGHDFDEQERMLAPPQAVGEVVAPARFDSLKVKAPPPPPQETKRVFGTPKRKAPPVPIRPGQAKAPPKGPEAKGPKAPEKTLEQDTKAPQKAPPKKAPPKVVPKVVPKENEPIAARLREGAEAAGLIKSGVEAAKVAYEKRRAQTETSGPKGKSGQVPTLDHTGAASALAYTRGVLVHDADEVAKLTETAPGRLLQAAGDTVEVTANKISKKVETPHVESTRDLAVALREGNQAMLQRVLQRGGELSNATLVQVRGLAQNAEANVYEMKYLGMAPVAYKLSKLDDPESEDPTLREHQTMRSLEGDDHVLKAGGKTLERRGFIMELARKGDLAGVQERLVALPIAERIEVWKHLMRGGFKALDKLHQSGRSHGDVKNQNFLLGDDYEPRLMDFGTTGRESKAKESGTAMYMAPELHKTKAKKSTDVWSMGESLLLGVFGMNSMDFAKGGTGPSDQRFGEDLAKKAKLEDGKWLGVVGERVKGVQGGDVFMDFIKRVMTMNPKQRLSAKQALRHDFLKLGQDQRNPGKELLRRHI